MSDKYLEFANSKMGKSIVSILGLPKPPRLIREDANNPHYLSGNLRLGTTEGALYATQIKQSLEATDLNLVGEETQSCDLVFDASGVRDTDQALSLIHI